MFDQRSGDSAIPHADSKHWLVALAFAAWLGVGSADSCGFHNRADVYRGMLNQLYPNALHVTGAIMQARQAGILPGLAGNPPSTDPTISSIEEQLTYARTMSALHSVGLEISNRTAGGITPDISILILDTVLWSRYSPNYSDVREGLHHAGPEPGDIILVTDEPVLMAIRDGSLTFARSVELGLIRVYGNEQDSTSLVERLGDIGATPLEQANGPRWRLAGL